MEERSLTHYGVKGMRWGVIRDKIALARSRVDAKKSGDYKTAKSLKKKKLSELSNEELKKLNKRLQLEQDFKRLKSNDISAGKKRYQKALNELGDEYAKKSVKFVLEKGTKAALELLLNTARY